MGGKGRASAFVSFIVIFFFAGCLDVADSQEELPLWGGGDSEDAWSILEFHAGGEPGTWVMGYQPLAGPANTIGFNVSLTVQAETPPGTPVGAFLLGPRAIVGPVGSDAGTLASFETPVVAVQEHGGRIEWSVNENRWFNAIAFDGQPARGIFFAFASTGAWNLTLRVELTDPEPTGPVRAPSFVSRGSNVTFLAGTPERISPAGGALHVGHVDLHGNMPTTGWTHVQVQLNPFLNDQVHCFVARLPDATEFWYTGLAVQPPGLFGVVVDFMGFLGAFQAPPGPVDARLDYVLSGAAEPGLALVHMEVRADQFPPGLRLGPYWDTAHEPDPHHPVPPETCPALA